MLKLLLIAAGGAAGTIARYGMSMAMLRVTQRAGFPVGTLIVNVVGCFLIGYLNGVFASRANVRADVQLMLVVGFLGGFTTFSALGWETMGLVREGAMLRAAMYVVVSNGVGIAMVFGGWALAKG